MCRVSRGCPDRRKGSTKYDNNAGNVTGSGSCHTYIDWRRNSMVRADIASRGFPLPNLRQEPNWSRPRSARTYHGKEAPSIVMPITPSNGHARRATTGALKSSVITDGFNVSKAGKHSKTMLDRFLLRASVGLHHVSTPNDAILETGGA